MCYQVEVLELQDDKAIITVGESAQWEESGATFI